MRTWLLPQQPQTKGKAKTSWITIILPWIFVYCCMWTQKTPVVKRRLWVRRRWPGTSLMLSFSLDLHGYESIGWHGAGPGPHFNSKAASAQFPEGIQNFIGPRSWEELIRLKASIPLHLALEIMAAHICYLRSVLQAGFEPNLFHTNILHIES